MAMVSDERHDSDPDVETRVLWKTISSMQSAFSLSDDEMQSLLGGMPKSMLDHGKASMDIAVSQDVRDRVSLLLGVYTGLKNLFEDEVQALTWIGRANSLPPFDGATPRSVMVCGDYTALVAVRRFLDYWSC